MDRHQVTTQYEKGLKTLQPMAEVLSLAHLIALLAIGARPGISVNELASELQMPQQTASRHVAFLLARYQSPAYPELKDPLIVQEVHPDDPRSRSLKLSKEGERMIRPLITLFS